MRADRLLSILLLLQAKGRMTARELSNRLEVSERTIHRDMDALSGAGVPVYAERGTGGGWELLEEYRTDLTGLNEAEIRAIFAAKPSTLLTDLGLHQSVEAALIKLLAALPSAARQDAEQAQQSIHIDVNGWQQTDDEDVAQLPRLQRAIAQKCKVQLRYQRGDGTIVERLVDPLGLVASRHIWYLMATVSGEQRTYRVSRVQAVEITNLPAERPTDFDLAMAWEESKREFKAGLPTYYATLRVAPETVKRLGWGGHYARVEHIDAPAADGWQQVRMRFQYEEDAAAYVLSYGTQVVVLEPPTLRTQVIQVAERVLTLYT